MRRGSGWAFAVAVMAASCGDDADGGGGGGGDGDGGEAVTTTSATSTSEAASSGAGEGGTGGSTPVALEIVWEPCPLNSDGTPGPQVECATIPVPSRWEDPSSEKIDFFVKRVPAAIQPARAQVWYLEGGPGVSGDSFDGLAPYIAGQIYDVDQYLPDHRGTGRSSRLGCSAEGPATENGSQITASEWSACLADLKETTGDLVTAYTITNAARDLGEVIAATRAEDQQVIVFGGSYGTAWANRYLTLYPDQPTAVGMSALFVNQPIDRADVWFNELGERWMNICAEDEFCSARLGEDPWATMTATFEAMDEGWCSEVTETGLDRYLFQYIFSVFYYRWWERALIPAMVYRLNRCDEGDIATFASFREIITTPPEGEPPPNADYFSKVLNGLISTSELWSDPPPSAQSFVDFMAQANVAQGDMGQYAAHFDEWPRYEPDEYKDVFGTPTEHMLLIGGELDFITAESREPALAAYEGPDRPFILMPRAGHTLAQSPYANNQPTCAIELLRQFIADPEAEIDTSCVEQVAPIQFEVPSSVAQGWMGVADAWGADPEPEERAAAPAPPQAPRTTHLTPEMVRALAPVREALLARDGMFP